MGVHSSKQSIDNNTHTEHDSDNKSYSIVVCGDSGVGKTSMIIRFADNIYKESYINRIEFGFKNKLLVIDNTKIKLRVWDTSGEQRHSVVGCHYRKLHGYMVVYDICDRRSFDNIIKWLEQIRQYGDYDNSIIYLVGTKSDTSDRRVVSFEEAQKFATTHRLTYFETSSKDGVNVEECFMSMASNVNSYNATKH
ncbi:MAG: putative ras-related protein Rab-35 [Homavirus sp.]|uniref:Putative ras-related protein Rab-35 n=1 Tax=Homavirus sp. TaxID=2487769 RepID=A0A3G5A566_9VIRU|nr:MAG: putative ras-related protein Rab-35 [Homavirus sp.]